VKDQLSNSVDEWARLDAEAANKWLKEVEQVIAEDARDFAAEGGTSKHLITVDELRAAGALDVPPSWRKSLGGKDRDLFADLLGDDESLPDKQPSTRTDADGDGSADELR